MYKRQLPTAGLTSTATTICDGDNIDFTASGGTMYEFYLNGTSVQGPSATDVYSSTTLVDGDEVTVDVTDGNGCLSTSTGITITVNPLPIAGLTSTATTICSGENVDFIASGGSNYEFFVNGISVQGSGTSNLYASETLDCLLYTSPSPRD